MINGIGFAGKMQAGKDTSCDLLTRYMVKQDPKLHGSLNKLAFGHSLKLLCQAILGLSYNDVYTSEGKAAYNETWGMTNREILQKVGTDAMRNNFHPDVWVKAKEWEITNIVSCKEMFFITDVRFPNEADCVHRNGGIIVYIDRPALELNDHASENMLANEHIDLHICNDGTLEELADKLTPLYHKYMTI